MTEFSIYQINVDRDTANVCFIGMESLEKIKGTKEVNAAAYDRVYDGKMDCISLENIYQKFNVDHPADYKGRSLSVSDVVEIRESDTLNPGFYFVDSIGFKSISFDKSLCKEPVEAGTVWRCFSSTITSKPLTATVNCGLRSWQRLHRTRAARHPSV